MAKNTINVQGIEVRVQQTPHGDFICLTDIAKTTDQPTDYTIKNWLRNRGTVEFLGVWEEANNEGFNPAGFDGIKTKTGLNNFSQSTYTIMKHIFVFLLSGSIFACSVRTDTPKSIETATDMPDLASIEPSIIFDISTYFDSTYEVSKEHKPFMVTGNFNADKILDTAILIKHKSTGKDGLFIKHGNTNQSFLFKNGKELGTEIDDFNWVGQFEMIKKGTKVWDNVIDGEIVGEDQVPEHKKLVLKTDGIFVHENEACGSGIIYFKNGKYVWIQQD